MLIIDRNELGCGYVLLIEIVYEELLAEKTDEINQLKERLNRQKRIVMHYNTMKKSKEKLEKEVVLMSKQLVEIFSKGLPDHIKQKLNIA